MPAVIVLGGSWLAGIATVALWDAPPWLAGVMVLALVPAASVGWLRVGARVLLIGALVAVAGAWRFGEWDNRPAPDLARFVGTEVEVEGTIASLPAQGLATTSYRFEVDRVLVEGEWEETSGALRLVAGQYAPYRRGDRLRIQGDLTEAPAGADFDYRAYLARQGIVGIVTRPGIERLGRSSGVSFQREVDRLRLSLESSLERALPEPHASLAAGIALGRDDGIPPDLYDDFRTTGLAHIVAVSGSNVALLTGMVFLLLTPLAGYYRAIAPSFAVVLLYVFVAGAEESVIRAGVMAGVFLASLVLGRQQSGVAALAVAAFAMTALNPGAAADVGFQLSLAATAGLIVFGPWIEFGLRRACGPATAWAGGLLQIVAWTIAATVATLPITWLTFGQISVIGVLANVIVEPVFALALAMSLLTAGAGVIWAPAGWVCGIGTYYPLAFITGVAGLLARVPGAAIATPRIGGTGAAAMYAALAAAGLPAIRYLPPDLARSASGIGSGYARRVALAGAGGGMAVAAWWWGLAPVSGPGELEMAVLDVGQGDAILVTTPGGAQVLVDGGRSGQVLAQELGAVMPHWDRKLEAVILTHPQEDHVAGLPEALRRFRVDVVYDDGVENGTEAFETFHEESGGAATLVAGDRFEVDGVSFSVLWPPAGRTGGNLNDRSLVVLVEYGTTRFLLTGDIEGPAQRALMEAGGIEADVLKVSHHGSATSIAPFFEAVGADVAVISVGEANPFGHPRAETLAALERAVTYRTDKDGRVGGQERRNTAERAHRALRPLILRGAGAGRTVGRRGPSGEGCRERQPGDTALSTRFDGRKPAELRPVKITRDILEFAEGSCIVEFGKTRVLCAASVEDRQPGFLRGTQSGWVTGEYSMLPRATHTRMQREVERGRPGGRTQEIQRLIGRSLRGVVDLELLGPRTITVDCDVLQADGGTRTASITGGFVALQIAIDRLVKAGTISDAVITSPVAAVSVGIVKGQPVADLCYEEDSTAEVDFNVVMTGADEFIEVQGTAEGKPFSRSAMDELMDLARNGIVQLFAEQRAALAGD